MGFVTNYQVGGEVDKVKYVKEIKNFAQLPQPYNKMVVMDVPAITGKYEMEYISPENEAELLSIVVTCSGYGEDDYYNLYVNGTLWFETWYPTEVKEGLYIGTSTYVYKLDPQTVFTLEFHNNSGTSKKVWMGIRMLVERTDSDIPGNSDPNVPTGPSEDSSSSNNDNNNSDNNATE